MIRFLRFLPDRWWSPLAWKTWMTYVHWRLETYGAYYPDGKLNGKALRLLLRQMPSYNKWLSEMDRSRNPSKS